MNVVPSMSGPKGEQLEQYIGALGAWNRGSFQGHLACVTSIRLIVLSCFIDFEVGRNRIDNFMRHSST